MKRNKQWRRDQEQLRLKRTMRKLIGSRLWRQNNLYCATKNGIIDYMAGIQKLFSERCKIKKDYTKHAVRYYYFKEWFKTDWRGEEDYYTYRSRLREKIAKRELMWYKKFLL